MNNNTVKNISFSFNSKKVGGFVVIFQTTSSTTLRVAILKIRHTTIILQLYRNYKNHQTGKSGTLCSKKCNKISAIKTVIKIDVNFPKLTISGILAHSA